MPAVHVRVWGRGGGIGGKDPQISSRRAPQSCANLCSFASSSECVRVRTERVRLLAMWLKKKHPIPRARLFALSDRIIFRYTLLINNLAVAFQVARRSQPPNISPVNAAGSPCRCGAEAKCMTRRMDSEVITTKHQCLTSPNFPKPTNPSTQARHTLVSVG